MCIRNPIPCRSVIARRCWWRCWQDKPTLQ